MITITGTITCDKYRNIHSLVSSCCERHIQFRSGAKYAVMTAAYFNRPPLMCRTASSAIRKAKAELKLGFTPTIVDIYGYIYDIDNNNIVRDISADPLW